MVFLISFSEIQFISGLWSQSSHDSRRSNYVEVQSPDSYVSNFPYFTEFSSLKNIKNKQPSMSEDYIICNTEDQIIIADIKNETIRMINYSTIGSYGVNAYDVKSDTFLVSQQNQFDSYLLAFSPTGNNTWNFQVENEQINSITLHHKLNITYVRTSSNMLIAIEMFTNNTLWQKSTNIKQDIAISTLDDSIYIWETYTGCDLGFITALDPLTGDSLWNVSISYNNSCDSTFQLKIQRDGSVILNIIGSSLTHYIITPYTHKISSYEGVVLSITPTFDRAVYFQTATTGDNFFISLINYENEVVWTIPYGADVIYSGVTSNQGFGCVGVLYISSRGGEHMFNVAAFSLADGTLLWQIINDYLSDEGSILMPTEKGTLLTSVNGSLVEIGCCNGNGVCQANDVCICKDNYYLEDCSAFCDNNITCNNNGNCTINGTCLCTGDLTGEHCDTYAVKSPVPIIVAAVVSSCMLIVVAIVTNLKHKPKNFKKENRFTEGSMEFGSQSKYQEFASVN